MNEPLRIGDVAIVLPSPIKLSGANASLERFNGREVVLIAGPQDTGSKYGPMWHCRSSDGDQFWCCEACLRKKRPPQKEASWDRIQEITRWNPHKKPHIVTVRFDPAQMDEIRRTIERAVEGEE